MLNGNGDHDRSADSQKRMIDDAVRQFQAVDTRPLSELMGAGPEPAFAGPPADSFTGYTILKKIHHGGQGLVYLARHESTDRHVAIKVMKEGPFTRDTDRWRFDREIRILSQLNHPNIVTIHDTGTASGFHFFAMDFISGQPLDVYMASRDHTVDDTLRLFGEICAAVNAAHLCGIIHRDLKPGNIRIDEAGQPHILDFGLAKIEGAGVAPASGHVGVTPANPKLMTVTGQFVGSLPWASPEQAEGAPGKIDIRTDVYSLGVVLYQMLTGKFPYDVFGNMRDVLGRIIGDAPQRPRVVRKEINDEVETIVLKCLAKEPDRRYQSAGDLAKDVQRYLTGEPIEAKRDSAAYVLRKQLRKHKLPVAVAAAFLIVVFAGLATSLTFWRQAVAHRDAAEAEHQRAEANFQKARDAVDQMLSEVGQSDLADVPGMAPLRRALLEKALEFYQGFLDEEADDPAVRFETALAFERVGRIHAVLGQHDQAEPSYHSAIGLLEELSAADPTRVIYRETLADTLHNLAFGPHQKLGRLAEAEATSRRSISLYEQLAAELPDEPEYRSDLAAALQNLGELLRVRGRLPEAEQAHLTALELKQRLVSEAPGKAEYRASQGASCGNLGILYYKMDRLSEAEQQHRRAMSITKSLVADFPAHPAYRRSLSISYSNLGNLMWRLQRLEEAEAMYRGAIDVKTSLIHDYPFIPTYRAALGRDRANLANVLSNTGRAEEAEREYRLSVELHTRLVADFPKVPIHRDDLARAHNSLGVLFLDARRFPQAEPAFRQSADVQEELVAEFPAHPGYRNELSVTYSNLGIVFAQTGNAAEAANAFGKSVDLGQALVDEFQDAAEYRRLLAGSLSSQALLLRIVGRFDDAEAAFRQNVTLWKQLAADAPAVPYYRDMLAVNLAELGILLHTAARQPEAADVFGEALAAWNALSAEFPKRHKYQRKTAWLLATCPDPQFRNADRALELAAKAVELAPRDGEARLTLGVARYRAENWQEAIADLNTSMELRNGGDSAERFFTAMAHWQLGDKDQARQWYDRGLRWIEDISPAEDWHARYRAEAAQLLGIKK